MKGTAKLFASYLELNKVEGFVIEELADEVHSVIFRTQIPLRGQTVPLAVICDDTMYTLVRANLATEALSDKNAFALSSLMMRLNHSSKLFKYYLAPDGSILLDACIPYDAKHFSPKLVMTIVNVMVKELEKEYGNFVRILWDE